MALADSHDPESMNSTLEPTLAETVHLDDKVSRRQRLGGAVVSKAVQMRPLLRLLDTIQPHVASDSVFHLRRLKIRAHFDEVYKEIRAERPKRQALTFAFQALSELVQEEARDISRDELRQAAKEVVLATLKNAPALINAAHQARLLS
ncbi:hypothetical protein LJY25_00435 [Hymenobacter sp. BT175]|uniref:hypothetical protein n=1 Tax=Hymenobacter translucens TaxID=2886507 RepID=UPI001D0F0FA2|nr:hypothetical protein [Hymenobacter translucens]MCC2544895.1 hypothetical protein [Hymenobacter translucens]